jgi:hypothetical protein
MQLRAKISTLAPHKLASHLCTVVPDIYRIEHTRGRGPRGFPLEINCLHKTWLGEPEVLKMEAVQPRGSPTPRREKEGGVIRAYPGDRT